MAVPTKDQPLADWSVNFNTKIVATPTDFNLSAAQATAYTAVHTPFITAFNDLKAARDEDVRSGPLVASKDLTKANLLKYARELYAIVQASQNVTPAQKQSLGVAVRDVEPSPQPVPGIAPAILVLSAVQNTVRVRVIDPTDPLRRAKPLFVDGIALFAHVGETAPSDESDWTFQGNVTRTTANVIFPTTVAAGARVWLTAFYFNERKQSGPAATPVSTNLPGGAAMAA